MTKGCRERGLRVAGVLLLALPLGCAQTAPHLVGTWRLVAFEAELQSTGAHEPLFGEHPAGYVVFTQRRAMFMLAGSNRLPPKTNDDRAALLNSLIAYTGPYRLEGDRWITRVEVAWNPEFVGTEQTRFFELDGDRLRVLTTWGVQPNWPEKGVQRRIITFVREE